MFFHRQQLLLISDRVRLVAQILYAALECQTCLTWLILRKCGLAKVVEEFDVQVDQNRADFTDPVFRFAGLQKTVMRSARYLTMQGFQQKPHVLGLGFGLDRCDRVGYLDALALGNLLFQFADAVLELSVAFLHVQHALHDVQLQPRQQQLQGR